MTKDELKNKIQALVKQVYPNTTKSTDVDLDSPSVVSLDSERFPVLVKFPTLKDTIVKLLTNQYELFLKDIEWVAPRPTTFRIILGNDQVFYMIYTDRTWISKVEGKKYYLLNLNEEQNCIEAIARILSYGTKAEIEKEEVSKEETSPEEPPVETPTEEVPPQA
jgi:hypothetical protein